MPGRIAIPVGLSSHHLTAAQVAAASQAAVLEQLRDKLETGEPPEKKVALTVEEQQRLMQHALQHNLLAVASQFPMNIKVSNRGSTPAPSMVTPSPGTRGTLGRARMHRQKRALLQKAPSSFCFASCLYWYFLSPDDRQETALNLSTNGISSINMSIEINGVVYTGK